MRWANLLRESKSSTLLCGTPGHRGCLWNGPVTARLAGSDRSWAITRIEDVDGVLASARNILDGPISDLDLMVVLGICPSRIIYDPMAMEAWTLLQAIEASAPWPWSGTWYDQPAVFQECVGIIRQEQANIHAEIAAHAG